jgi:3-oxoacyl-[acyl-carrier protein] reductase
MSDQSVLVTGASRGIGSAIARELAATGYDLVLNYNQSEQAAEETRRAVEDEGSSARLLQFDVSDRETATERLERDIEENGPYYGVVLNAGIHRDAPFPLLEGDDWDRVMDVNLGGVFNVLKPVVMPLMRNESGGRIVTISSVSGLIGRASQVNYSASKAGIVGATKSLAQELGQYDVTVNCVAPGLIDTEMVKLRNTYRLIGSVTRRKWLRSCGFYYPMTPPTSTARSSP